ncbi:MAG: DUF4422 domain-containing protein [Prolixibacteraceae bacterium]
MGDSSAINILVFHYKNGTPFPELPAYQHIWAGKNGHSAVTELTGDDTGNNISSKNNFYSELTGIYWFWKNQQSPIIGTSHYRRFFTAQSIPFWYRLKTGLFYPLGLKQKRAGLIYCSNANYWKKRILNQEEIGTLLSHYDAILPQARKLKYTVEEHFKRYHHAEDLILLEKIIAQQSPELSASFLTMLQQKKLYANNMFVLRKAHFDELATWLFSILFEFEKQVDLNQYTGYQKRLFGFLSERLITTWFQHHSELKIKELPLIYLKHFKRI